MERKSSLEVFAQDLGALLGALERSATAVINAAGDIRISTRRLKLDIERVAADLRKKQRTKKSVYDVDGHVVD